MILVVEPPVPLCEWHLRRFLDRLEGTPGVRACGADVLAMRGDDGGSRWEDHVQPVRVVGEPGPRLPTLWADHDA